MFVIFFINWTHIPFFPFRRRCSIKKAVLKNFAIFIRKSLCWRLFLIYLQAYKAATLLQRDSNTGVFLWILQNFQNIYFKGHLWTNASELYWFKVEVMVEKTETYSETIIGDVFRTQWNIKDGAFCKYTWLYLTVDYFCKTLHIISFTGLCICLDKTKQKSRFAVVYLTKKFRNAISPNLFSNSVLSSHYYFAVRH